MKKYILISIAALIICNIQVIAQKEEDDRGTTGNGFEMMTEGINYQYDNAGNRIKRIYVELVGPIIIGDDPVVIKSAEIEIDEDETLLNSQEREIQVYPNPVKDELFVDIQKGDINENYRLMIFDSAGKMLKESRRQGNGNEPIDMSLFPSGVYFLIINTQEGKVEYKIVKE